jgi:hypothetical protein
MRSCLSAPASLGRRHGFSAAGMRASAELHRDLLSFKRSALRPTSPTSGRRSSADSSADSEPTAEPRSSCITPGPTRRAEIRRVVRKSQEDADAAHVDLKLTLDARAALEEFVGTGAACALCCDARMALTWHAALHATALVLAFLQVAQLMPVVEIAARRSAAAEHFGDLTSPGGWDFDDTFTKFLSLIMPGTLNTRTKWWVKVRAGATCRHAELFFDALLRPTPTDLLHACDANSA